MLSVQDLQNQSVWYELTKEIVLYFAIKVLVIFHIFTACCICSILLISPFSTIQSKQLNPPPPLPLLLHLYIYMGIEWLQSAHTLIFTEILKLFRIPPCVIKPSAEIITWQAISLIKSPYVSCTWLIFFDIEYNNVS